MFRSALSVTVSALNFVVHYKLSDDLLGIEVDLTAHPFSTGQTELIDSIKNRKAGELHPLVNRKAFIEHLSKLRNGAEKYLKEGHV